MQILPLVTCGVLLHATTVSAVVFFEEFSGSDIDPSVWTVKTSATGNWGASITADHVLQLTNSFIPGGDRTSGHVSLVTNTTTFSAPYQSILNNNPGLISWSFNMQQIRSNPAGFGSGNYGVAMVLGATNDDFWENSQGYAVVLGNHGSPDAIKLVSFTDGLSSLGSNPGPAIITAESPLDDPAAGAMSIQVTYDPGAQRWSLFGRLDGLSFEDPTIGVLDPLGTGSDHSFTDTFLPYMGPHWQGSFAADQTAHFDNFSSTVVPAIAAVPEPRMLGAAGASLLLFLIAGRRIRRRRGANFAGT